MGSKIVQADVLEQFERYRALTGSRHAYLVREDAGTVTFYKLTAGGQFSFSLIGAAAAYMAIKSFCDGFEAGREEAEQRLANAAR